MLWFFGGGGQEERTTNHKIWNKPNTTHIHILHTMCVCICMNRYIDTPPHSYITVTHIYQYHITHNIFSKYHPPNHSKLVRWAKLYLSSQAGDTAQRAILYVDIITDIWWQPWKGQPAWWLDPPSILKAEPTASPLPSLIGERSRQAALVSPALRCPFQSEGLKDVMISVHYKQNSAHTKAAL